MKRIVLCADDYGQAANISQAIIDLVAKGRLSAVSCLVNDNEKENNDDWREAARALHPFQDRVDIGLHFNLTEGKPLSFAYQRKYGETFMSLKKLMWRARTRQLDIDVIAAECVSQLHCFIDALGFAPTHLDGHQHVHQFPVIQDAIINVYQKHLRQQMQHPYLRLVNEKMYWRDGFAMIKKVVIRGMGGKSFARKLAQYQILHNSHFAGIYQFARQFKQRNDTHAYNYSHAKRFTAFLKQIADGTLMMCHPGLGIANSCNQKDSHNDAIASNRNQEYTYFASDEFLNDLQTHQIKLVRFIDLL